MKNVQFFKIYFIYIFLVRPLMSVASVAAERFAEIGETLNKRMESIDSKLDFLIKERQETNTILKNIVIAIESLKK